MAKSSKLIDVNALQRFWDGFKDNIHIHENKTILDNTTASYTTEEKEQLQYCNQNTLSSAIYDKDESVLHLKDVNGKDITSVTIEPEGFVVPPTFSIDAMGHLISIDGKNVDFEINNNGHLLCEVTI